MIFSSVKLAFRHCFIPGRARRCFMVILLVSLTSLWMLLMQVAQPKAEISLRAKIDIQATRTRTPITEVVRPVRHPLQEEPVYKTVPRNLKETGDSVLLFVEYSQSGRNIIGALLSHRFKVNLISVHQDIWPSLTHGEIGAFSVLIFESLRSYSHLSRKKNKLLEDYCKNFNVGIIIFTQPDIPSDSLQVRSFPLFINQNVKLKDPIINKSSGIPRITKASQRFYGNLPDDRWTTFRTNHSTYTPVMEAKRAVPREAGEQLNVSTRQESQTCVVYDRGSLDGIRRIYFGYSIEHFLHITLLLDSIAHLTQGQLQSPLERYILIDVDDIFVGKMGIRLTVSDVENMVSVQEELRELVTGFRFNLGYSGKYFQHGTEEENAGDQKILQEAHHFWWFPHMWDHTQPHNIVGRDKLRELMVKNRQFALDFKIPITKGYSVAPHHSGVYPVHEELYNLWKEIWNVEATSTEEYPHLRPAYMRKGFIHKHVMVIPRQTCGLFTHTNFFEDFRGGQPALDAMIRGGELFKSLVNNPVNVFMTHMSNYGSDRLGLYTFKHAFQFMRTYTNLRLQTLPPVAMAKKYFELHPEEREPLWGNPCEDKRQIDIWAEGKDCSRLPNSLILGPQKTGTTALYTFLQMHKKVQSNRPSDKTFEEVQFFNGQNYFNGLDWYLDFFPSNTNETRVHIFEKSANYFDSRVAPKRVKALLPKAKLIVILLDPARRAYSWYHHMRAHEDQASLQYSFHDVITARADAPGPVRELQRRCLEPAKYSAHLDRWLQHFPARQILPLDGDLLRNDPPSAMMRVQRFLRIKPVLDYSRALKYNSQKGFFCRVGARNRTHCLGAGKGRKYGDMDAESAQFLKAYYREQNLMLSTMLENMNQTPPEWLAKQLDDL